MTTYYIKDDELKSNDDSKDKKMIKNIKKTLFPKTMNKINRDKNTKYVQDTLRDLPFATMRAEANKRMSYKFDSSTGRFFNENGDSVKTMKEAVKINKENDDAFGPIDQVKRSKTDIQLIYDTSDPRGKATLRKEFPSWNFKKDKVKQSYEQKEDRVKLNYADVPNYIPTPPPPPLAPQEKIIKPNPIQYDQHGGIGYPERPTKLTVEAIKDLKWNREND